MVQYVDMTSRDNNTMMKLNFKPFSWIAIRPSLNGSKGVIDDRQRSTYSMYSMLPWDSPYDENGKIVGNRSSAWVNSNSTNYLYELQYNWSKYDSYSFNGNFDFDIYLTDWLTFSSVNSYRWSTHLDKSYVDPRTSGAEDKGRVSESTSTNTRRYTNQLIKATRSFGDYHGFLMLGYEFNDGEYRYHNGAGQDLSQALHNSTSRRHLSRWEVINTSGQCSLSSLTSMLTMLINTSFNCH